MTHNIRSFCLIKKKTGLGDGFDKVVNRVADIEKQLGIYKLSQFTPR